MIASLSAQPAPGFADDFQGGLLHSPCANVQVQKREHCRNEGTLACSSCTLVTYCSAECQKSHWKQHKIDCKDKLRQEEWQPKWMVEGRRPSFVGSDNESGWQQQTKFGLGLHLWGNMPASDILRLKDNEGLVAQQAFALALVASGDIRHLVLSINGLPDDYSGNLTLLLNDRDSTVTYRNLLLLEILTSVKDVNEAAETATHLWFSAFLPHTLWLQVLDLGKKLVDELRPGRPGTSTYTKKLTNGSSFFFDVRDETKMELFRAALSSSTRYDVAHATNEYNRVMLAPSRVDYRDRGIAAMEPNHRLSWFEHRRCGIVLPFAALNAHHNVPNRLLFSPFGDWMLNDSASPLESWDPEEVIKSGLKHGIKRADLYGCLYFHLQDHLRSLAARLRRFKVSLHLTNSDMLQLSKDINKGDYKKNGLLPTTEFDRVEVSNTIDIEYLGVRKVLESWGTKLKKENPHATLFAYSMNWSVTANGAAADDPNAIGHLMSRLPFVICAPGLFEPVFNSGPAYRKYLEKHGIKKAAKNLGLKLKEKHSIMPPRPLAPLKGDLDALPVFPDKESWYLWVRYCFLYASFPAPKLIFRSLSLLPICRRPSAESASVSATSNSRARREAVSFEIEGWDREVRGSMEEGRASPKFRGRGKGPRIASDTCKQLDLSAGVQRKKDIHYREMC
ncbi:hypothetical protein BCR35DRAFT_343644 [Leucosporidium creatinivorum]|uniref:MYND-type domain-containing protein n=1 Tax=Leucosporidium creatinivorum TaxID=106004 RepID=A0A1Y2G0I0_9BASI|nr:hypothetical protein BCR35DRAFT_343644 [Leucosporidium creatinivorum]